LWRGSPAWPGFGNIGRLVKTGFCIAASILFGLFAKAQKNYREWAGGGPLRTSQKKASLGRGTKHPTLRIEPGRVVVDRQAGIRKARC